MFRGRIWRDLVRQAAQIDAEELLGFFQKRRNDKWTPEALVVLLERLPHGSLESPEFFKVLQDLIRRLPSFNHQELPRMLKAMNGLQWRDKGFYKTVEDFLLRQMPLFTTSDIATIAHCFVQVKCGSRELFNMCIHKLAQEDQVPSASDVATLTWTFAQNSYKPFQFLTGISLSVATRCPEFTNEELVLVLGAYADWPKAAPTILLPTVLNRDPGELLDMEQGLVVQLLQSLATIQKEWKKRTEHSKYWKINDTTNLIAKMFVVGASRIEVQKLDRKLVSRLLWAYSRVNVFPPKFMDELEEAAVKTVKLMPIDAVAASLLSVARYRQGISPLHAAAEEVIDKHIKDADERDIASLATAYALGKTGSPQVFALLSWKAQEKEFPAENLASLLWSFATVRVNPKVFAHLQVRVLEVLHHFSPPAICDMLWAFDVVRMIDAPLFDASMRLLHPSAVQDPRCALLYPALLYLPIDQDIETMDRYREYVRPHYWEWQLKHAEPLEDIEPAIAQLGEQYTKAADVDGYYVDFLLECTPPVCILLHGANHLHHVTNQPLGETMMRHRYLTGARKLKVINLWKKEWLEQTTKERVAYISERLHSFKNESTKEE